MKTKTTIGLVIFVHNDLRILARTLAYNKPNVDQICILDLGSTDGLEDFCKYFLSDIPHVYEKIATNIVPAVGFGEVKTKALQLATTDWIVVMGANGMLFLDDWNILRHYCNTSPSNCLSIPTMHVPPPPDAWYDKVTDSFDLNALERGLRLFVDKPLENHRRVFRRSADISFKGYIHEEPVYTKSSDICVPHEKIIKDMRYVHFEHWTHCYLRSLRYSYMYLNVFQNVELQKHINPFWIEEYIPKHFEDISREAAEYLNYCAEHKVC